MKKTLIYLVSFVFVFGGSSFAMAQSQQATTTQPAPIQATTTTQSTTTPVTLPPAGLTPDSPFYFFNQFIENVQRFFTFNPEAKARLELKFAAERVSEINAVIIAKGVESNGVKIAEASLRDSLNRAAQIVASEKAKGSDVSQLASSLNNEIGQNRDLLSQTFENQKDALDKQIETLKAELSVARTAGDTAKVDALTKQIQDMQAQKDLLDNEKHGQEDAIDNENAKVEDQLGGKEEAAKKIQEVKDSKNETVAEYQKEGVEIPAGTFGAFDGFLAQAQSAFDAGNYGEAISSARQANRTLNSIERTLENLKEAKHGEDQLNADQEELQKEADKAQNENAREAIKQAQERLRENQKNVQEDTKKAQEQLREDQKNAQEQLRESQKQTQEGAKETGD